MNKTNAPVKKSFILVCEKCGKKLSRSPEENPAREIQKVLKKKANAELGEDQVRPMISSCMNICPENEISIGILDMADAPARFFTTAYPANEAAVEKLWQELKEQL